MDNRLTFKNPAKQKVSVLVIVTLQVKIGRAVVRLVFYVVRISAMPVLLRTSEIKRFVKDIFYPNGDIPLELQVGTDSHHEW